MMLKLGLNPLLVRYSMLCLKASTMDESLTSATGVARMAFDVQSYRMKIVVMPSIERRGNLPVKSV